MKIHIMRWMSIVIMILLFAASGSNIYAREKKGASKTTQRTEQLKNKRSTVTDSKKADRKASDNKSAKKKRKHPESKSDKKTDGKTGSGRFGIDVSHHNGVIEWQKVAKKAKPLFVYIKATEGSAYIDKDYKRNITEARKAGLRVGSYHFFRMTSGAHAQFRNFIKMIQGESQDLIPMVDIETTDGHSRRAVRDSLVVFLNLLQRHYGVKPLIYSHNSHYNDICAPELNNYPLYIARYHHKEPVINGGGKYTIWQYSETGRIDGMPGFVDLARFNKGRSVSNILLHKGSGMKSKKTNKGKKSGKSKKSKSRRTKR
ncbi:MAG: hypothetical protein K2M59_03445 [Muribaculaceae bacterium]|nr:hypothetical protein [Muribaculaceae bacterium]